jgi:hypothetical protein
MPFTTRLRKTINRIRGRTGFYKMNDTDSPIIKNKMTRVNSVRGPIRDLKYTRANSARAIKRRRTIGGKKTRKMRK